MQLHPGLKAGADGDARFRRTTADSAAKRTRHGWIARTPGPERGHVRNDKTEAKNLQRFASRASAVLRSRSPRKSLGPPCASDDLPHTIHYHGGPGLSSPSRTTLSNQPVAVRSECGHGG